MGRILIVDDEEPLRAIINEILRTLDFETILAENGNRAIELAKENDDITLMILDWNMPGLTGEETYKGLHEVYPDCPVIFTSGYDLSSELGSMNLDCTYEFLRKPFRITELSKITNKMLNL